MAGPGLLERRARSARFPRPRRPSRRTLIRVAAVLAVVLASLGGGLIALTTFAQDKRLSVGTVNLSVEPFHRGALDLYVPLVDWGVRFNAVRFPARLHADIRSVDRRAVQRIAQAGSLDLTVLRREARNAIAAYLKELVGVVVLVSIALGLLVALAVRSRAGPRLRWLAATAAGVAIAWAVVLIVLLPPRGAIDRPTYYAFGGDIPRALNAVENVERSTHNLDEELDAQLVGLARLVINPGQRAQLAGRPTVTIASDLHNNVLALSTLERAAGTGPVLFPGDLTDRGTPLETSLVRRVVRLGHPFVFVSGNHDSNTLEATLSREGAIVLTQWGRLLPNGKHGAVIANVGGMRIAGYSDPYERRSAQDYKDIYNATPTPEMQDRFLAFTESLIGKVDVIMVHEPALIEPTLAVLRDKPPSQPIAFVVGHTHHAAVEHFPGVSVINGGSVGAGGTGNLTERTPIGIARMIYSTKPRFQPLAADLVSIDPGTGSATAQRVRLDNGDATPEVGSR
jgi:predicted phosphodiesterase